MEDKTLLQNCTQYEQSDIMHSFYEREVSSLKLQLKYNISSCRPTSEFH